jgi:hypothetical protein
MLPPEEAVAKKRNFISENVIGAFPGAYQRIGDISRYGKSG